jgi:hypothetical protein
MAELRITHGKAKMVRVRENIKWLLDSLPRCWIAGGCDINFEGRICTGFFEERSFTYRHILSALYK